MECPCSLTLVAKCRLVLPIYKFSSKPISTVKEDISGNRSHVRHNLTLDCRVLFLAEKLENHSGNCMELTLRLFIHHLRLKIIFP